MTNHTKSEACCKCDYRDITILGVDIVALLNTKHPRTFSQLDMMTTLGSFSALNSSLAARFFSCL